LLSNKLSLLSIIFKKIKLMRKFANIFNGES